MKLSIWQQFSSNHSANFSLVAQFDTVDAAELAVQEARQILLRVKQWYEEAYPDIDERHELPVQDDFLQLTAIEQKLKEEKKLKSWEYSIDWAIALNDGAENTLIQRYENLLIMENAGESWLGSQPFDELIGRTAKAMIYSVEGIDSHWPHLRLSCLAPSETEAEAIIKPLALFSQLAEIDLPNFGSYQGKISRDGLKLLFEDLPTSYLDQYNLITVPDFLKALVDYLKAKGCKDFHIEIYKLKA